MYLLIARSILIKLIKCRNLNRRYKNIQYKGYFMHRVYVVSGLVPLPEFYWRNVPNSIHFPFLSWLVFYANFNIISVISRQQFTYIYDPRVNKPVLGYKLGHAQGQCTLSVVLQLGIKSGTPGFKTPTLTTRP